MFELRKNLEINRLIEITKSGSGVSGPELAKAHIELGRLLGSQMEGFLPEDTTIVAMLRGGIFFAEGMYFAMGCHFETYDPKQDEFTRPGTKNIILADSVVNTGRTMLGILKKDMYVACCVINDRAVPMFADQLFTVRVSKNSFIGKKVKHQTGKEGPDTTMRLFNQL